MPDGKIARAELDIGDSIVMLNDARFIDQKGRMWESCYNPTTHAMTSRVIRRIGLHR